MSNMFPDAKKMCHRTGFEKSCAELVASGKCQDRWVHINGQNKNTGEDINRFGCVDDHAYLLQIGMEHRLVGIQSAVETRGDNIVKAQMATMHNQERQHREALNMGVAMAEASARQVQHYTSEQLTLLPAE